MAGDYDKLWMAVNRFAEAKREHDKAYEEFDGYSWDWYGRSLIESVKKAQEQFEEALNEIIDARINAQTK